MKGRNRERRKHRESERLRGEGESDRVETESESERVSPKERDAFGEGVRTGEEEKSRDPESRSWRTCSRPEQNPSTPVTRELWRTEV
jgi:hypothetical protein